MHSIGSETQKFILCRNMAAILRLFLVVCLWPHVTCYCKDHYDALGKIYYEFQCELIYVPTDIPVDAKKVWLNENKIIRIEPGVFSHLSQCTYLDLSHNQITTITGSMLNGLNSLIELFLQENDISKIRQGAFGHLPKCTELHLSSNKLSVITNSVLKGLVSLEKLYLYENDISSIMAASFSNTPQLWFLSLGNNKLTTLSADIFSATQDGSHPAEVVLTLSGNPLQCDSRLYWLKQAEQEDWITWWSNKGVTYYPECENLPGTDWKNITLENITLNYYITVAENVEVTTYINDTMEPNTATIKASSSPAHSTLTLGQNIGIIVSIFVILVILVLIVIFCKKRGRICAKCRSEPNQEHVVTFQREQNGVAHAHIDETTRFVNPGCTQDSSEQSE